MDVDKQETMEETILVGDDLMRGPPSPVVPKEIASHVLEGVELCDGILKNLFLCLQINDIEPFCQDEIVLYKQCAEKRDKEIRERLQDSEYKLGFSMPLEDAKERVTQLQSELTLLESCTAAGTPTSASSPTPTCTSTRTSSAGATSRGRGTSPGCRPSASASAATASTSASGGPSPGTAPSTALPSPLTACPSSSTPRRPPAGARPPRPRCPSSAPARPTAWWCASTGGSGSSPTPCRSPRRTPGSTATASPPTSRRQPRAPQRRVQVPLHHRRRAWRARPDLPPGLRQRWGRHGRQDPGDGRCRKVPGLRHLRDGLRGGALRRRGCWGGRPDRGTGRHHVRQREGQRGAGLQEVK